MLWILLFYCGFERRSYNIIHIVRNNPSNDEITSTASKLTLLLRRMVQIPVCKTIKLLKLMDVKCSIVMCQVILID